MLDGARFELPAPIAAELPEGFGMNRGISLMITEGATSLRLQGLM
jgi:hypothetical protein